MKMKDHFCPEGKRHEGKVAELNIAKELEAAAYLESIDQAKWNIWRDFKFAYGVEITPGELELKLTKLKQELENEN